MLCQFIFKNFKSYRDETIFDLQATTINEHADSLLNNETDSKTFLPVSVIYGPNAGGKSGVLEALNSLISHVMDPIDYMQKKSSNSILSMRYNGCSPFAFDDSTRKAPTKFTVFFRCSGNEYRYTLDLFDGHVFTESMYRKKIGAKNPAKIFNRDSAGIQLGASLNKKSISTEVNAQIPFLSFLAVNYNFDVVNSAIKWFSSCLFINYTNPVENKSQVIIESQKEILLKMLQEIDIPILDYHVEFIKDDKSGSKVIKDIYISRNINGKNYFLNIFEESSGTFKLFRLLPFVIISLHEGRLLVVDELDANLHPKLLRYIIMLYTDKSINKNNAQLLFTSHDVTTMKNDIFRRDEIWFAAKDEDGASEIFSLYEIRNADGSHVKANTPFDKQYMEGRYGADPYFSEMLSLKWEE